MYFIVSYFIVAHCSALYCSALCICALCGMLREKKSEGWRRGDGRTHGARDEDAKVLDHALAVKEVVGGGKKVPREGSEPRQFVRSVHDVADGDDLVEALDLDGQDL